MDAWWKSGWFAEASRRKRWLVGVSGGMDSVALLHAMRETGFKNVVVCHANHGLRGKESTKDAAFVKKLAAECGYPHDEEKLPVKQRMKERSESLETAARHERMEFFSRCGKRWNCRRIVLAHHAGDQAETVLWNLLRGSYGLRGMEMKRELAGLEIHRPLLHVAKRDLQKWLRERDGKWREDASNAQPIAVRNRLRNEAFPLLDKIAGRDVAAALGKLAEDFREMEEFVRGAAEAMRPRDPQGRLHVGALREMPLILRRETIRSFLTSEKIKGVDRILLEKANLMAEGGNATLNLPGGKRLRRRQGRMFVEE